MTLSLVLIRVIQILIEIFRNIFAQYLKEQTCSVCFLSIMLFQPLPVQVDSLTGEWADYFETGTKESLLSPFHRPPPHLVGGRQWGWGAPRGGKGKGWAGPGWPQLRPRSAYRGEGRVMTGVVCEGGEGKGGGGNEEREGRMWWWRGSLLEVKTQSNIKEKARRKLSFKERQKCVIEINCLRSRRSGWGVERYEVKEVEEAAAPMFVHLPHWVEAPHAGLPSISFSSFPSSISMKIPLKLLLLLHLSPFSPGPPLPLRMTLSAANLLHGRGSSNIVTVYDCTFSQKGAFHFENKGVPIFNLSWPPSIIFPTLFTVTSGNLV